jgi:MATE family multidrug resistance protein
VALVQIETRSYLKNNYKVKLFSAETTSNCKEQIKLGIAGMFMGVWGWWAFDIFTLIASYLSVDAVSAQTIMRSLGLLTFMIPVGFSTACGVFVGKSIGEKSVYQVNFYFTICMSLSLIVGIL